MSRFYSWLNASQDFVSLYSGDEPFASFIKKHFARHKKYGSKDRKNISQLCYGYFRLGKAFDQQPVSDRILLGSFLSSNSFNDVLHVLKPLWNENITLSIIEKFSFLHATEELSHVFPLYRELSNKIDREAYQVSMFHQPFLFIRVRPGRINIVDQKLKAANIQYERVNDSCLVIANSSKVDAAIQLNEDAVIQDLSSQNVLGMLPGYIQNESTFTAWDCCAASGGKSILLKDMFPRVQLTVSDIRETILRNLHQRFRLAGIKNYHAFVADLTEPGFIYDKEFDLVICDAPCSGSGTWARTPEQLAFFKHERIAYYSNLQKSIAINASKSVKKGGYFLYITCSVFEMENEGVADFLQAHSTLQLISQQYFKGYDMGADTLYAALFKL
ncbi:MAG TPA: methyltransferase domain-containing protein [Flavisolibacter sp.]|nr:methyltransferase domain-containing protein [Flavisolibacter sp.]